MITLNILTLTSLERLKYIKLKALWVLLNKKTRRGFLRREYSCLVGRRWRSYTMNISKTNNVDKTENKQNNCVLFESTICSDAWIV